MNCISWAKTIDALIILQDYELLWGNKLGESGRSFQLPENVHTIGIDELFSKLETNEHGLSKKEALQRLGRIGPNVLSDIGKTSPVRMYVKQYRNFFSILLTIGALLSLLAEYLSPGQGNIYIGIALLGVVILNATFTFIQEYQAEKIMASFHKLLPPHCRVLRDGEMADILAHDLVPGDIMIVEEGDKVPADGRLIDLSALKVDNSPLTGEAEPQLRSLDCTHPNILECRNMVFSGTLVQTGNGRAIVTGTGSNTQIGQLAALTHQTESVETPLRKELNHFIHVISSIAMFLGISFFAVGYFLQEIFLANLIFAIGIIVANVPEGLLPTVTLALSISSKKMAKKNALIKQLESVETLGSTTVICTDKTGTLTQNKMAVSSIVTGFEEIGPDQYPDSGNILTRIMGLCNNSSLSDESPQGYIGDPTEGSLLVYAGKYIDIENLNEKYPRVEEFPFDSLTKNMQVICSTPEKKLESYLKGAPEVVIEMCDSIITENGVVKLSGEDKKQLIQKDIELAEKGERVIAFAYRPTTEIKEHNEGFIFTGFAGTVDPPRPEIKDAISKCHSAGIKVVMITGDHPVTARSIAKKVGLNENGENLEIITGSELEELSMGDLSARLKKRSIVFARTSPVQKLKIVQAFQAEGEVVTMTGDGVNDAPAIKNADMGVAMGSGTDVAREAADMVLLDDNFASIVNAVEEGRRVFDNIKKFIAYILTSNTPEIIPFIAFVLLALPLPMPVQLILAIDLGTDLIPALALAMEKSEGDIMNRPPRSRSEKLLTAPMLLTSYGIKGPIEALAGFVCYFAVLFEGGWVWGQQLAFDNPLYRQSITAFFAAVIICQIANLFISRTRRDSAFSGNFFSNKYVFVGIASELLILSFIMWNPVANLIFNTAPLKPEYIFLAIPFAMLIFSIDEIRKYLIRKNVSIVNKTLGW
ncbi:sodium/potassium-transporting ATPase subunit alpha [Methanohalophilus levihalophilus]|uniref:cation-translocating P-type ATPase n=1 Tax=Methanohalophilus levihalophilus TaxID=1431282 RepID=UPI001AE959EF|nr:HAD-IC family P-type ATPase [Methanohalophilus levihalophilus]MBP2030688.1 sodium/potassium-transporting ATPase subunit alpha [Methanohalophilus levihalophilus]